MKKDIRFVAFPTVMVDAMLELSRFGPRDPVHDLGCGDGRLIIAAARLGARAVGIDVDPGMIERSRENARLAHQQERTESRQADLFQTDLSDATVATIYLLDSANRRLQPELRRELASGARLVSHSFDMDDWQADRRITVDDKWIFLWTL